MYDKSPFAPNAVPAPVLQRRWRKFGITFGRLMKFSRCGSRKRKIPPTQRSDDFVGWIGGKMNRVCCRAVNSFVDNPRWGSVQNEHNHILQMDLNQSTRAVGFVTENIIFHMVRQDGFVNFIAVKCQKSYCFVRMEDCAAFVWKKVLFYAAVPVCGFMAFSVPATACR